MHQQIAQEIYRQQMMQRLPGNKIIIHSITHQSSDHRLDLINLIGVCWSIPRLRSDNGY